MHGYHFGNGSLTLPIENIFYFTQKGGTALMIAAQEGSDEMARILLGEGKCKRDLADKVTYMYIY